MKFLKKELLALAGTTLTLTFNNISNAYVGDMQINEIYSTPANFPRNYKYNKNWKVGSYTFDKVSLQTKWTENWAWGSENKDFDEYYVSWYQVGTINAPYDSKCLGNRDASFTEEISYSYTQTESHELSITNTINSSSTFKAEASGCVKGVNLKSSREKSISYTLETSSKNTSTNSKTFSKKLTKTYDEPGTYFAQLRANFAVIEVQQYEIVYNKVETGCNRAGLWQWDHFYRYDVVGYKLVDNFTTLSQVSDNGFNICKYELQSDGLYKYADYIGNDDVEYI